MSDMQFDHKQPQVFAELVRQGVLPLLSEARRAAGEAPAALLIAGDLVRHGRRYEVWSEEFFRPLAPVARHVPIFPVAGNHDEDSPYYFRYFTLPSNGSADAAGRWWWADFSNVRVIGLDSNEPYRTTEQLAWLEHVLGDACANGQVDFVFATLHHPERSELWPHGELSYSGLVAHALERFASACAKPSVIFSGHTHAYSRGHNRDHRLTSISVASAGGDLDRIGEYPQRHYVEYVTSQDEYGFVVVDVQAGQDPWFRLRRISRGNPQHWRANELRDEVLVRRFSRPPVRPEPPPGGPYRVVRRRDLM